MTYPAGIRPIRQCLSTGIPVASAMRPCGAARYALTKAGTSAAASALTGPNRYASRPASRTAITGADAQAFIQPTNRASGPIARAKAAPPSQFAQTKITSGAPFPALSQISSR